MNSSWLGRGRGGRLAIYAGCTLILIFIMLLYRAASIEMGRLRKVNELCTHQQEALASQLQVIYDYKVRLEKFLADEKSSNLAVKQELQQRATREKSLRDKDSVEAMQRFNALQQTYKLLQTENQDLAEEYKNFKTKDNEDNKKQMALMQQLKDELKAAEAEKKKSMEHLKSKYMELENEKSSIEDKYNELLKKKEDFVSNIEHLRKEIVQLKQELDGARKSSQDDVSPTTLDKDKKGVSEKKTESVSADLQEQREQLHQPSPSNQLQSTATSPVKAVVSAALSDARTKSSVSTVSSTKVENAQVNPLKSKMKLPQGVVPIPKLLNERETENKLTKEKENGAAEGEKKVEPGNLAMIVLGAKQKVGKENENRQNNRPWMQEVGDEDNVHERLRGFEDPGHPGDLGEENYDEFYKDRPQKNYEGEDEREDDLMDYPENNLKSAKRE